MKQIGIFEVKTRLSEVCEEVARTQDAVVVTRRGAPLVRIEPIRSTAPTIRELHAAYQVKYGAAESPAPEEFEVPPRPRDPAHPADLD